MRFCTTINCMDRQVQLPGIEYFEKRFNGGYFSSITEAGPHLILAEQKKMKSNFFKLGISMENHGPVGLAITRHHGCAGNPAPKDEQIAHVLKAINVARSQSGQIDGLRFSVDKNWTLHEIENT